MFCLRLSSFTQLYSSLILFFQVSLSLGLKNLILILIICMLLPIANYFSSFLPSIYSLLPLISVCLWFALLLLHLLLFSISPILNIAI